MNFLLNNLFAVASESEANMLDDLLIRAGIWWRCPDCQAFNTTEHACCEDCGTMGGSTS